MKTLGTKRAALALIFLTSLPGFALAAKTKAVDKSKYSIFRPTPYKQMRAFGPDRPSKTEGPYTIDAGHFQFESDLVNHTQDTSTEGGVRSTNKSTEYATTNFRVGLTNSMDFHVIFSPYVNQQTETETPPAESHDGMGDTVLRMKINFLGNDGGDLATGILPYAKIPTNSGGVGNKAVEGGVILPLAINAPYDWALGFMVNLAVAKNQAENDNDMHNEIELTACAGHDLVENLNGYVELAGTKSSEANTEWAATFDFGLTYLITPDFSWDVGANLGLTEAADDFNPFMGISARF